MNREIVMNTKNYESLKIFIWIYAFLIVFEGALRKWFLPSLSTPLLLIRDPIAIYIVIVALIKRVPFGNNYIKIFLAINLWYIPLSVVFGHESILTSIYGARILMIHFPLMFIIGKVMEKEDIIKIGKTFLWLSIPMTMLLVLQFFSPSSAFINIGVGGIGTSGFSGALGYQRPSGTFSFTTGNTSFYIFCLIFCIYFWFTKQKINRFILLLSSLAILIALPTSVSRSLVVGSGIVIIFGIMVAIKSQRNLKNLFQAIFGILLLLLFLNLTGVSDKPVEVMTARFEKASDSTEDFVQNSIYDRFILSNIKTVTNLDKPIFQFRLGEGTQGGARLLNTAEEKTGIEGELIRLIYERGLLIGWLIILCRGLIALDIVKRSWRAIATGEILPWLLCSKLILAMVLTMWGNNTLLGFAVLYVGFSLAILSNNDLKVKS